MEFDRAGLDGGIIQPVGDAVRGERAPTAATSPASDLQRVDSRPGFTPASFWEGDVYASPPVIGGDGTARASDDESSVDDYSALFAVQDTHPGSVGSISGEELPASEGPPGTLAQLAGLPGKSRETGPQGTENRAGSATDAMVETGEPAVESPQDNGGIIGRAGIPEGQEQSHVFYNGTVAAPTPKVDEV